MQTIALTLGCSHTRCRMVWQILSELFMNSSLVAIATGIARSLGRGRDTTSQVLMPKCWILQHLLISGLLLTRALAVSRASPGWTYVEPSSFSSLAIICSRVTMLPSWRNGMSMCSRVTFLFSSSCRIMSSCVTSRVTNGRTLQTKPKRMSKTIQSSQAFTVPPGAVRGMVQRTHRV